MGRDIALAIRYLITHVLLPIAVIVFGIYIIGITVGQCSGVETGKPDTTRIERTVSTTHHQRTYRLEKVHIPSIPLFVYRVDSMRITADTTLYREQKVYQDSTYTAFVSGIDAQLDSIRTYTQVIEKIDTVYQRQEYTVTQPVMRKDKWPIRLGATAGPTITPHGLDWGLTFGVIICF